MSVRHGLVHRRARATVCLPAAAVVSALLPVGSPAASAIAVTTSSVSPLLQIDLSFSATKNAAVRCTSGSERIYTGTLKGKLLLATGLKRLGTVGSSAISFGSSGTAR